MQRIEGQTGEIVVNVLSRALRHMYNNNESTVVASHNGVDILVYRESCLEDLCDKYDMARKIKRFEEGY